MQQEARGLDEQFLSELQVARESCTLPKHLRAEGDRLVRRLLAFLFPQFAFGESVGLEHDYDELRRSLSHLLTTLNNPDAKCVACTDKFLMALPRLRQDILEDAQAISNRDPASEGLDEVLLAYPGIFAIATYRLAHELAQQEIRFLPRIMTEFAHRETGIDIHPDAKIGKRFSIDHGTGVVIGQTAIIGDDVTMFQGVTLGAMQVAKSQQGVKRHPTVGNRVTIYANAIILGGDTVIGDDSVIGGNVWLTRSVPPNSVITRADVLRKPGVTVDTPLEYEI
ncbi:MAG: serine acetyltransferase [Armatimonadetes bacterium]|nr:serine acetyltransferase [Armatimonadota bacterium]